MKDRISLDTAGRQKTISREIGFQGIGLHKGQQVKMNLCPAPADSGIIFQRVDLPGEPSLKAGPSQVVSTQRSTNLGQGQLNFYTVEHIMAAARGLGIDNLVVQLDDAEPPVGDGSALPFARLLQEAGIEEQDAARKVIVINEPLFVREGDASLILLPYDGCQLSYCLSYPETILGNQYASFQLAGTGPFLGELAPARTFGFTAEVSELKSRGLALGGSLDNAVLFTEDGPVNPLRFADEPVRHKILDLVGDLALVGCIKGEAIGIKSGHTLNNRMAALLEELLIMISEKG